MDRRGKAEDYAQLGIRLEEGVFKPSAAEKIIKQSISQVRNAARKAVTRWRADLILVQSLIGVSSIQEFLARLDPPTFQTGDFVDVYWWGDSKVYSAKIVDGVDSEGEWVRVIFNEMYGWKTRSCQIHRSDVWAR